jgi:hypothetical protein
MNTILKDEIIKDFENKVNNKINTLYDVFYIIQYKNNKYGAIFNGNQIALCEDLISLEQVINTIIYFLERGGFKR